MIGVTERSSQRIVERFFLRNPSRLGQDLLNGAKIPSRKDEARRQPEHSTDSNQDGHVLPRPDAAHEHHEGSVVVQWAEEDEPFQRQPELRQVAQEEKTQKHEKHDGHGPAA